MMQINSAREGNQKIYSLLFQKTQFIFLQGLNLEYLSYFSVPSQQKLGKTKIKFNINCLRKLKQCRNANFILVSKYQQILLLPYLLRNQQSQTKILISKLAFEAAKIYIKDFYQTVKKIDQIMTQPSYEEQSLIYDKYEEKYDIKLENWVQIFTKKQIQECFQRCVALNYGQIYDTQKGIKITPFSSGYSLGSAVWLLQSIRYQHKILWISDICHHSWRACKEFNIGNLHSSIDTLIFTKSDSSLIGQERSDEFQCVEFFKKAKQQLIEKQNVPVIIDDMTLLCDFINYISWQLKQKFQSILISSQNASKMINYANSYVEFLSAKHARRIYEDPPVYPFENFNTLKNQQILFEGFIEQIAEKTKLPIKQFLRSYSPYLHFVQDYHAYLYEGNQVNKSVIFQSKTNQNSLCQFFNKIVFQRIYSFMQDTSETMFDKLGIAYERIQIGQQMKFTYKKQQKIYLKEGQSGTIVSCKRKNDFLILQKLKKQFKIIRRDWQLLMREKLLQEEIKVTQLGENSLRTENSLISLINYEFSVRSRSPSEIGKINSIINGLGIEIQMIV